MRQSWHALRLWWDCCLGNYTLNSKTCKVVWVTQEQRMFTSNGCLPRGLALDHFILVYFILFYILFYYLFQWERVSTGGRVRGRMSVRNPSRPAVELGARPWAPSWDMVMRPRPKPRVCHSTDGATWTPLDHLVFRRPPPSAWVPAKGGMRHRWCPMLQIIFPFLCQPLPDFGFKLACFLEQRFFLGRGIPL